MNTKQFVSNLLEIAVEEKSESINVCWTGKSIDRNPGKFITPILASVLDKSVSGKKEIILDFRKLAYLNSSTITPIIKVLERAKRGTIRVTILYDKSLKWQELNFSALEIFITEDKRVDIEGL
ncbi:MAG: hypothetical protein V3V52_08275 [Candidatus Adiutricales bacterium]|jgi:hypothetical protein